MTMLQLVVQGMSCGHCVRAVRNALEALPGVTVKDVQVGFATIDADDSPASIELIKAAVEEAGYAAEVR
jgi:copper chaperone CopZ